MMPAFYLSRLLLNPAATRARRDLGNVYELHRTVMSGFPEKLPDGERVLFRVDEDRAGGLSLLVQSQTEPDWGGLAEGYLQPLDPFSLLPNLAVKRVDPAFRPGQQLRFRLLANPTVKLVRYNDEGERRNSNRVPLVDEDKQLNWLTDKARQSGFHVLQAAVNGSNKSTGRKTGVPPLTLFTVQFDGRLQVTDADMFGRALVRGIGPARAFGCGLLSLAPA